MAVMEARPRALVCPGGPSLFTSLPATTHLDPKTEGHSSSFPHTTTVIHKPWLFPSKPNLSVPTVTPHPSR